MKTIPRWLWIGVLLGLLSALSGWYGVQGWSGPAGGRPLFMILGLPFFYSMIILRSWWGAVLGSLLAWVCASFLVNLAWRRFPDSWRRRLERFPSFLSRNRRWVAVGTAVVTVTLVFGILHFRGNRSVRFVGEIETAFSADVEGGVIYVAQLHLRVYQVDPGGEGVTRVSLTQLPLGGNVVRVRGPRAYVVSDLGLQVVDVSDPTAPVLKGAWEREVQAGSWLGFAESGDLALVSHSRGTLSNENVTRGLTLIDLSDPDAPTEVSVLGLPKGSGSVGDVTMSGGLAFVAARRSGLFIFDISDPSHPRLLSRYEPGHWARGVAVKGGVAFLSVSMTSRASWIHVLDIQDPAKPVLLKTIDTVGPAQRISIEGDRLYIADQCSGLLVFNISTPSEPRLGGRFRPDGLFGMCSKPASSVAASEGLVALEAGRGVLVLEDES